jgi:hypothetical protein
MGTLGHIIRGVEASALGTLVMDTLLYRRLDAEQWKDGVSGGPDRGAERRPATSRSGTTTARHSART